MAQTIKTVDMHTGGEPLRIVVGGAPKPAGSTVLECRKWLQENADWVRKALMWEPRGHADMYGCFITPPERGDSDFGAVFMHNEGYSTMCGHATLALARYAVNEGLARNPEQIRIDVPCGQVVAKAEFDGEEYLRSSFVNVPSFVLRQGAEVDVEGAGRVAYDIAFGGAFYAFVEAKPLGLSLEPNAVSDQIRLGRAIKKAVRKMGEPQHPTEPDLSFLYGVIFVGEARNKKNHSRNVCVFADGEVDRSATGSGVSARAALHMAKGELQIGEEITIESVIGSTMSVKAIEKTRFGNFDAVVPEVTGTSFYTGRSEFVNEEGDDLGGGFLVR